MKKKGLESSAVLRSGNGNAAGGCVCSARSGHYHHGLRRMGRSTSRLVQRRLKYSDGFATDDITAIRVGMEDNGAAASWSIPPMLRRLLWQKDNGYLVGGNLSSAPFYKENNGTPLPDGMGSGLDGEQGRSV